MPPITRRNLLALALALPALSAAARAQSNAERILTRRDTRSHDFDLVHQRIELRDFDWDSASFRGRVTTTLVSLAPRLDSVILDAGPRLTIDSALDAGGRALSFRASGDTLVVRLARDAAFGDTVRFGITYHGRAENGQGLTFIKADGRPHRPQQLWSMGEPYGNHHWFPTYDFPNDPETWELVATVPRRLSVVSNGRLVSDAPVAGAQHRVIWAQERPSATYLVSIVVGELVRLRDRWRGIPVDAYVYASDTARARRVFRDTPDAMERFSRLTGVPYPWAKYAQTTVADFFGGEEMTSATTLVDWLPDAAAYRDRPWYAWALIPHELAHQWFGDYVMIENWSNEWVKEGAAEFMNGAYWEDRLGRHASDDFFLEAYDQYLAIDAERRMPLAAYASNNIYPKGALVLRMLRRQLGDARFWASIHRFLSDHRFAAATSADLQQAVLEATGENLDWFWAQWVYGAGHPDFDVRASYDTAARVLTLAVKQTQSDTVLRDSSTDVSWSTAGAFRAPIVIRVHTPSRDVVIRTTLDAREQQVRIGPLPADPTAVIFDDGNVVLKTLTFEQPTAWLATQLAIDPDLWNRRWAIGELAQRAVDTAARVAIARAALGADYDLTRAEATAALAAFPRADVVPTLATAAHDRSAAVRAAALGALATLGGEEALALTRAAFARDSSYTVRAAALAALVHLDSAGRRGAIRAALRLASYRDIIQLTALDAAARLGDSTLEPAIDSLIAVHSRAALVLGSLASRGSTRALDMLTAHLDDPRPWVREWTLAAFARRVSPRLAQPRLAAVVGTLRFADTRAAAAKLLATLSARPSS